MSSSTRIPPLLQPYIQLPRDESLLLLTSTLGASANWLLIRFLCDALRNQTPDGGADGGHNVVLVSWMRDYEFWKQEARKGGGLDLERLKKEKRFAFVDGLCGLVMSEGRAQSQAMPPQPQAQSQTGLHPARLTKEIDPPRGAGQILPARAPPARSLPARGPPPAATRLPPSTPTQHPPPTQTGHYTLHDPSFSTLKSTLTSALAPLTSTRKTLLILDNPDLLLALTPLAPSALPSLLLSLHTTPRISHILTHLHADTPLLTPSSPPQPLETAHFNLLTKVAHMSARVIGTRVLDTGVARDVSGVVRVTGHRVGWIGLGLEGEGEGEEEGREARGREFLYLVKGDGGVRVFERGAGGEG